MAKACAIPTCSSTELVYSGTDAFMLGGIPTETYCYECANIYARYARTCAYIEQSIPRYTLTDTGEALVSQTSPAKG
jgi:hypothetical protein